MLNLVNSLTHSLSPHLPSECHCQPSNPRRHRQLQHWTLFVGLGVPHALDLVSDDFLSDRISFLCLVRSSSVGPTCKPCPRAKDNTLAIAEYLHSTNWVQLESSTSLHGFHGINIATLLLHLSRATAYPSLLLLSPFLSLSLLLTPSLSPLFIRWLTIDVEDRFQDVAPIDMDLDCDTILKLGVNITNCTASKYSHIPFLPIHEQY